MDNLINTLESAKVILGGQEWLVPMLSIKQNRIIDPLILGLLPIFSEWQNDKASALSKFDNQQYNALIEIAFVAIQKAQPELSYEKFLELPITLAELIAAFSVIAQQTGIFEKAENSEKKL